MNKINLYVFKQLLSIYIGSLILFYVMYVIIKFSETISEFLKYSDRLNTLEMVLYFIYEFPLMFTYFSPIAALFSVVFVISKLNAQNESIAIYNSGISTLKILSPMVYFAIVSCFIFSLVEDSIVYGWHGKHRDLNSKLTGRVRQDFWNRYDLTSFGEDNKIYFINKFSSRSETLHKTHIIYLTSNLKSIDKIISLKEAKYNEKLKHWEATDVYERQWKDDSITNVIFSSNTNLIINEEPFHFRREKESLPHLSAHSIYQEVLKKKIIGSSVKEALSEYHLRYAMYFTSVFILFLGIPIASFSRQANLVVSLFIVLIIVFTYFLLGYIGSSLGSIGLIPPFFSGWLANIIATIVSFFLWRKRRLI